jgi:hypothetical protein
MAEIHDLLAQDHQRIHRLLRRAVHDRHAYAKFRASLLRHISMEERILLPAARRANGGEPIAEAEQLRIDHGRLALLLGPGPNARALDEIEAILGPHHRLEEGPDGIYAGCERLIGAEDVPHVAQALRDQPRLRFAPILQRRRG